MDFLFSFRPRLSHFATPARNARALPGDHRRLSGERLADGMHGADEPQMPLRVFVRR
jgi:hypothetical protein